MDIACVDVCVISSGVHTSARNAEETGLHIHKRSPTCTLQEAGYRIIVEKMCVCVRVCARKQKRQSKNPYGVYYVPARLGLCDYMLSLDVASCCESKRACIVRVRCTRAVPFLVTLETCSAAYIIDYTCFMYVAAYMLHICCIYAAVRRALTQSRDSASHAHSRSRSGCTPILRNRSVFPRNAFPECTTLNTKKNTQPFFDVVCRLCRSCACVSGVVHHDRTHTHTRCILFCMGCGDTKRKLRYIVSRDSRGLYYNKNDAQHSQHFGKWPEEGAAQQRNPIASSVAVTTTRASGVV